MNEKIKIAYEYFSPSDSLFLKGIVLHGIMKFSIGLYQNFQ